MITAKHTQNPRDFQESDESQGAPSFSSSQLFKFSSKEGCVCSIPSHILWSWKIRYLVLIKKKTGRPIGKQILSKEKGPLAYVCHPMLSTKCFCPLFSPFSIWLLKFFLSTLGNQQTQQTVKVVDFSSFPLRIFLPLKKAWSSTCNLPSPFKDASNRDPPGSLAMT